MDKALELIKTSHSFTVGENSIPVLQDVNISVQQGEFIAVIGKSGSGKSTLLNLIAGFSRPTKGEIKILETDINSLSENKLAIFRQKNLGFIFQSYNLIQTMTAIENIQLPLELSGEDRKSRYKKALKVLRLMGLESRGNHYPNELIYITEAAFLGLFGGIIGGCASLILIKIINLIANVNNLGIRNVNESVKIAMMPLYVMFAGILSSLLLSVLASIPCLRYVSRMEITNALK